ncbi:uncharacterized protein [Agelaius tricolor]|uniref:uncharacterized protein isoform X3 n=1 Tax=Agelaius tricolor TaxID=9191 RepID=UPI0039F251EF
MMERLEPAGSVGERRGLIPAAAAGGDAPLSPRDRAGDGGSSRGTAGTALGSGAAPAWEQGSARGQLLGAGLGSGAAPAGCGWRSTSLSSSSSSSASSSSCARNPASHGGDPGRVRTYLAATLGQPFVSHLFISYFPQPCSPAGAALAQTPRHGRDAEMPERILGATLLRGEGMGGNSPAHHTSPSRAPVLVWQQAGLSPCGTQQFLVICMSWTDLGWISGAHQDALSFPLSQCDSGEKQ